MTSVGSGDMAARKAAAVALLEAAGQPVHEQDYEMRRLEGGWSRHTYVLLRSDRAGAGFVVRVKPDGALLDTDIEMEYRLYEALQHHPVKTPRVFGMDPSHDNPYEGPYFVLEWLQGDAPNIWNAKDRAVLERGWASGAVLAEDLLDSLVSVHTVRDERVSSLLPNRTFRDCVTHWENVYREVALRPDPVLDEVWEWLLSREPDPVEPGLVHGDYRIGNTLVDGDRITTILDWELSYWGDRRFDLGYLLQPYMAGKIFAPGSDLATGLAPSSWFLEQYAERTGVVVDEATLVTFSALGATMLMVILATGAHRFRHGRTSDIRLVWNRFPMIGLRQDLVRFMDW